MATDICNFDPPILKMKAQHDALGIEILLSEITKPIVVNYQLVRLYFIARRIRKYINIYDLDVCAKCHGFEECSKSFYDADKSLLVSLRQFLAPLDKQRLPWLLNKSYQIIQTCEANIEDRIEDMQIVMETSDGILSEIADVLDESGSKLPNWREALPFLQ